MNDESQTETPSEGTRRALTTAELRQRRGMIQAAHYRWMFSDVDDVREAPFTFDDSDSVGGSE